MFITFSDKLIDINCIESAGLTTDETFTHISLTGKSGTVYNESFLIADFYKEKETLNKRWEAIKYALFLSALPYNTHEENFPQEDDIPF